MAMETTNDGNVNTGDAVALEERPGILFIGPPNVGKRTLLSRLLSIDFSDTYDLSSGILCQGWTIDTKYYTADLSIWIAHMDDDISHHQMPIQKQLDALVMVFDMSDESSLTTLQDWVAKNDVQGFEILLCIGNKADLVTGHSAHTEYRRFLQKHGESKSDPHPEYGNYGIDETEGSSLLDHEDQNFDIRLTCLDWCSQHNIEYIEACASNADFDKCLSADGDVQGVERLRGALSAHMWPGMILKSGNKITKPYLAERDESTDDESEIEIDYEVLSDGSGVPWERTDDAETSRTHETMENTINEDTEDGFDIIASRADNRITNAGVDAPVACPSVLATEAGIEAKMQNNFDNENNWFSEVSAEPRAASDVEVHSQIEPDGVNSTELLEEEHYSLDELEKLMYEIGNMRENLRLMPDFQRREMAANLAMKMAAMFSNSSDEDDGDDFKDV